MIVKFKTIKSFAVFQNFEWDSQVKDTDGKCLPFKTINILFGRNYSGKTTLSRIVRALETGIISQKYIAPQFSVEWKDGTVTNNVDLQTHNKEIRVFNEDFVRENLNFLVNPESKINAFAVIGAENVKIENDINELKAELGNNEADKETGLYSQLRLAKVKMAEANSNLTKANAGLEAKMADKATGRQNGIKDRSTLFGDIRYDKKKLQSDIETVRGSAYVAIDDDKRQELENSLNEAVKTEIPHLLSPKLEFKKFCEQSKEMISRKIGGSEKIQELVREHALNEWVKKGFELHKEKRDACAFCGGTISTDRWNILEKHFDKETKRLENDILYIIEQIKIYKKSIENGFNIRNDSFYAKFHTDVENLIAEYKAAVEKHCIQCDSIISQLEIRKQDITKEFMFVEPADCSTDIEKIFSEYEQLRIKSNDYKYLLDSEKKEAQRVSLLNEVKKFILDIGYEDELSRISKLEEEKETATAEAKRVQDLVDTKSQTIEDLKRKLNDEEKGADKVNEYLLNFFGHEFLQLRAVSDESDNTGSCILK